jgi:hypothetical protein
MNIPTERDPNTAIFLLFKVAAAEFDVDMVSWYSPSVKRGLKSG